MKWNGMERSRIYSNLINCDGRIDSDGRRIATSGGFLHDLGVALS